MRIDEFCVKVGFLKSKSEASRLIDQKALYVNDRLILDKLYEVQESDLLHKKYIILRRGKKTHLLIKLVKYEWTEKDGTKDGMWVSEEASAQIEKEIFEGVVDYVFSKQKRNDLRVY